MKKIVISRSNLPVRLPIIQTIVVILALDYWSASGWIWGAVSVFLVLWWLICIACLIQEKQTDILKDK